MPDNITLLPCPNPACEGSEFEPYVTSAKNGIGDEWRMVLCEGCGMDGPHIVILERDKNITSIQQGEAEAARLWNKLPRPSAQLTERDTLRAQLATTLLTGVFGKMSQVYNDPSGQYTVSTPRLNPELIKAAFVEADAILAAVQETPGV